MLHPDYPLATERLLLRPATAADIDDMYAYKSRPDVCRLDARNAASCRVLERIGMRREALHLEDMWLENEWSDTAIYALLEHEWRESAEAGGRM